MNLASISFSWFLFTAFCLFSLISEFIIILDHILDFFYIYSDIVSLNRLVIQKQSMRNMGQAYAELILFSRECINSEIQRPNLATYSKAFPNSGFYMKCSSFLRHYRTPLSAWLSWRCTIVAQYCVLVFFH